MKVMCISDIHGNVECLNKAVERYKQEEAEKLLILGDFSGYGIFSSKDMEIAEILNNMSGVIIAVKGNCDTSKIDEFLNFGLTYQRNIQINGNIVTITHGHIYNRDNLPENCGNIFLSGHTHIGMIEKMEERIIANPGSISKPRGGSNRSYIIIDEEKIVLKSIKGEYIKSLNIIHKKY